MRSLLLATAAAVFIPVGAQAQEAEPDTTLSEVVVTATRLPAIVQDTPGARVIDQRAIDQRGAVFATDILNDVPGLSVVRSGAFGGPAQVRMRGAHQGKTLVLVDGASINDPADADGAFNFAGFDLSDIARIEVLSGPQSSLWGSDAIGGVIAFTTRELDGLSANLEAGSFDTVRGRLAGGVSTEQYGFGAWVSHFDTDGISAAEERDGNPEADGFTSTTAGAKGRYSFAGGLKIDGSLRWTQADGDMDGYGGPPAYAFGDTDDTFESDQWSGFGRITAQAFGLNHQFSLSASDIERTSFSSGFGSTYSGDRQTWRWQADGRANTAVTYAFGVEREETSAALSSGLEDDLSLTSVFGLAQYDAGRLNITGGVRFDDTDDFGSATTGRVSAAYDLGGGFTVSGALGTGFKAPTVSYAVCDFCYAPQPWPELRPEEAESGEIALGWISADNRISGRATFYKLKVKDQISYDAGRYINLARTATDGVELEGQALLGGGFDLTLAYAWTDAENEVTGLALARIPEHAGSATLGWTGDRLSGALTVRAEGDERDSNSATAAIREGFVTANVNAAYALTNNVTLTARVENLADEHYQQVLGYGEPGRSGYVGIRLRY